MTEPPEPQETPEPDVPVETPETPKEPTEGPETPDTPDEEEEPSEAPEETLSAQQPQGKSETEIEKGLRALEREAQRHAKRVGEIMEEDTQHLLRCELCAPLIPGFRWPQVPEDQRAAVMLAIGFEPQRQLRPDKRAHACPDCDGEGSVATGSKVKGQDALPCIDCVGSGWVGPRRDAPVQAVTPPPPAVAVNGPSGAAAADPERAEFERRAKELGFMVIDTRVPAATQMEAEEYIATYGADLSEADKRYIRAFGAPSVPSAGASRNPYTPTLQVADAPGTHSVEREAHRARHDRLDREAESYQVLARLVYWLPFMLLAVALAVVIWTVANAAVVHALNGVAKP